MLLNTLVPTCPGVHIELFRHAQKNTGGTFFERFVTFPGSIFKEGHIANVQMSSRSIGRLDINFARDRYRKLPRWSVVELLRIWSLQEYQKSSS